MRVVLYGRPGCHLCEEALAVVRRVATNLECALEEVDIETDDELFKRYLERIPVLTIDGRPFAWGANSLWVSCARLAPSSAPS